MLIQLIKGKPITKPARVYISRPGKYPQLVVSMPKEAATRAGINGHARVFADPENGAIHVMPPNGDGTDYAVVKNGKHRDIKVACPYFWTGIDSQTTQTIPTENGVRLVSDSLRAEL